MIKNESVRQNSHLVHTAKDDGNPIYLAYKKYIDYYFTADKFDNKTLAGLYVNRRDELRAVDTYAQEHLSISKHRPVTISAESIINPLMSKYALGNVEKELLSDFITMATRSSPPGVQILVGDMGSGKSTLCQYLFCYILEECEKFFLGGCLIHLDLKNAILDAECDLVSGPRKLKTVINSHLYTQLYNAHEKANPHFTDNLWKFISQLPSTNNPFIEEVAILNKLIDRRTRSAKIISYLDEIRKDPDRLFSLNALRLRYLRHCLNGPILLLVDNSDTIPLQLHPYVYESLFKLCDTSAIPICYALRYRSLDYINRSKRVQRGDLKPFKTLIPPPNLAALVAQRCSYIKQQILTDNASTPTIFTIKTNIEVTISPESSLDALELFIKSFTSLPNSAYLMAIANRNMKHALLYINRLLQTSEKYFNFIRLVRHLYYTLKPHYSFWGDKIPLRQLQLIHLLERQPMFVREDNEHFQNIYCCGREDVHGNVLVKYRILEILSANGRQLHISCLASHLIRIFGYSKELILEAINDMLIRPYGLLWAHPIQFDDLEANELILLSESGQYYYEQFSISMPYTVCMYFDCFIPLGFAKVPFKPFIELGIENEISSAIWFAKFLHHNGMADVRGGSQRPVRDYCQLVNKAVHQFAEFRILASVTDRLKDITDEDKSNMGITDAMCSKFLADVNTAHDSFKADYRSCDGEAFL